ncbi:MAG TPA: glutathione S-transferase N-terminal domain-containing protein [Archangium sp.]|nr:glutathione S-transferase N-terminal domain-containing protein [Archangium sp.]
MLKLHHLVNSRSHRILWLLEELGLDYELVIYPRDPKTGYAPPELKALHPLGKSPLLEDDGRVLAESGAIIDSVVRRHGMDRVSIFWEIATWMRFGGFWFTIGRAQ